MAASLFNEKITALRGKTQGGGVVIDNWKIAHTSSVESPLR